MVEFYKHETAICESVNIGEGTRIWASSHVLTGAVIGKDCNICDHVFIENDVIVGDRVTVKCGVQLWDGIRIHDDVFIGPNATFTNDKFPRSKQYPDTYLKTTVEKGASIGANATILPGLTIGRNAMVGAGAVVTQDVPPNAILFGNPAIITGYVNAVKKDTAGNYVGSQFIEGERNAPLQLGVGNCQFWSLPSFRDMRGDMVPVEFAQNLPFVPQRQFFVFDVPGDKVRGEHSHKACDQFLIAVKGAVSVVVDNGSNSIEVKLDTIRVGLFIPAMIWGIQYKFTRDAVLAVYASAPYEPDDYIRSYEEYKEIIANPKS